MPFPAVAAAIAGGASLIGGFFGNRQRSGQAQKDRDFQARESGLSRQFSGEQAGRQMAFQERMRNTEWQAGVQDMEAAGINPALAYSQGGASTPMGSSGSGAAGSGSTARQEDVVSGAVASAMQYKRLNEELKNMKAVREKTDAEREVIEGRPGRMFGSAVDVGTEWMDSLVRNRRRIGSAYMRPARLVGSSAKQVLEMTRRTIGRAGDLAPKTVDRLRGILRLQGYYGRDRR